MQDKNNEIPKMSRLFVMQNVHRFSKEELAQAIAQGALQIDELKKFRADLSTEDLDCILTLIPDEEVETAWQEACEANTIPLYQAFIEKNPKHPYVKTAREKIAILQETEAEEIWARYKQSQREEDLRNFVDKYPGSAHLAEAMQILETSDWEASNKDSIKGLRAFLTDHPSGVYAQQAQAILQELEELYKQDENTWDEACQQNVLSAYKNYVATFAEGKHVPQALLIIAELENAQKRIKELLFEEMRTSPEKFGRDFARDAITKGVAILENGTEVYITGRELVDNGFLSMEAYNYIKAGISANNAKQLTYQDLPPIPTGVTDVFFFGAPGSGKSSVLSLLLNQGEKSGKMLYTPLMKDGVDPCMQYYQDLITYLDYQMLPPRTKEDTCNLINMKMFSGNGKWVNPLCFVELGGEFFYEYTQQFTANDTSGANLRSHGGVQFIKSNNRKIIFFLIDYSIAESASYEKITKQKQSLERAIFMFSGAFGNNTVPVFSQTDTVCVIVSKADKMQGVTTPEERVKLAQEHLLANHRTFFTALKEACAKFGMNKATGFQPIITTFSVGTVQVGDTVSVDYRDAFSLQQFIQEHTRAYKVTGSWWDSLKKAFTM